MSGISGRVPSPQRLLDVLSKQSSGNPAQTPELRGVRRFVASKRLGRASSAGVLYSKINDPGQDRF